MCINRVVSFQLHTSDIGDGLDWNRLNLKSVTEENTLDEFLATAELAGTEFSAGKYNHSNPDRYSFRLKE